MFIIAVFLLSLSACGHKAAPFYSENAPEGDDNVKFIIQKTNVDNNESCEK